MFASFSSMGMYMVEVAGYGKHHSGLVGHQQEKLSNTLRLAALKVIEKLPVEVYHKDSWSEFDIEIDNPLHQEPLNYYHQE